MRLQQASDLHLELRPRVTFEQLLDPVCPQLALLGDIAPLDHPNLRPFLEWCSERWKTVFWIPGRAEVGDSGNLKAAVATMKTTCAPFLNVDVMCRDAQITEDGVLVIGCPFWGPQKHEVQIQKGTEQDTASSLGWPRNIQQVLHQDDLKWLDAQLRRAPSNVVVLSQVGPVSWMQEQRWVRDPATAPVDPTMEQLLRHPIVAWVAGQVHQSVEQSKEWSTATGLRGSILLLSNSKGDPHENPEQRKDAVLRVNPTA